MARIEEYLPQQSSEGAVGGTSPNLEQVQDYGRGIRDFGQAVEEGGDLFLRRDTQQEQSEGAAAVSDGRASWTNQVNQQTQDGTLNTQKLSDDYDKWVSDQSENFSTPGGQNLFNRQAARLKATLLIQASHGQAQIAGRNAAANFQTTVNNNSSVLQDNPEQFPDVHDSMVEQVNSMVDNGLLPADQKQDMINKVGKNLSQSAVRGFIQQDYNSAVSAGQDILNKGGPDAIPKAEALQASMGSFNKAKQMMDSGTFDDYLNSNDKKALNAELTQNQRAAGAEISRLAAVQRGVQAEQQQQFEEQNYPKLMTGGLSTKDILSSQMPWRVKNEWLNLAATQSQPQETHPANFNRVIKGIQDGTINDTSQINSLVGKGLALPEAKTAIAYMNQPGMPGYDQSLNRKNLFAVAKQEIVKSGLGGLPNPDGELNMSRFTIDLQKAESDRRLQGLPVKDLYDPSSADYFANKLRLQQYKQTPAQILQSQAAQSQPGYKPPVIPYAPPGTPMPSPGGSPSAAPVRMTSPDGRKMIVPPEKAAAARKAGWKDR